MEKPEEKAPDGRATVELRVTIREAADMTVDVGYAAFVAGTDVKIPMRPSHIVGLLQTAAQFVIAENYDSIKAMMAPVQHPDKGKEPEKR